LLPFVENTFKHGIENDSGWITINVKVVGNRLFLKVENSCRANVEKKGRSYPASAAGLGLENVKRRLELTYPKNYDLVITPAADLFEVDLKLNL
jgi:two-component system LytT family sensor kinase